MTLILKFLDFIKGNDPHEDATTLKAGIFDVKTNLFFTRERSVLVSFDTTQQGTVSNCYSDFNILLVLLPGPVGGLGRK